MMKKQKGFTLVEVLIVIAVIGILASMMVISSNESVSTAKASNIITNLRNFSMAAMAYYTDKMDTFGKDPGYLSNNADQFKTNVAKYMHNEGDIPDKDNYIILNSYNSTSKVSTWWVGYYLDDSKDNNRVKDKLAGRAVSANLKGTSTNTPPEKTSSGYPQYTAEHKYVWLLIRSSSRP